MGFKKGAIGAIGIAYLLIALEIVIMISPFAAYFYSVYGPLLKLLSASPLTVWMADFFLPHMVSPDDPPLIFIGYLEPFLFYGGLALFFSAFIPLYAAKLMRKRVVVKGLYALVRHPQYLGLSVSGLGLLLYWPRFFILLMYITMLYLYDLLAKIEEERLEREFGEEYVNYKLRTPMFLPGSPGAKISNLFAGLAGRRIALFVSYLLALMAAIGAAFLLRGYTRSHLPMTFAENLAVVSVFPMEGRRMEEIIATALRDEAVRSKLKELRGGGKAVSQAYIMPPDFGMTGLVADVERRHRMDAGGHRHRGGLLRYLGFMLHHLRRKGPEIPVQRVFFVEVTSPRGYPLPAREALTVGARRNPLFLVEVDLEGREVLEVRETPPRHRWGDIPMPAF